MEERPKPAPRGNKQNSTMYVQNPVSFQEMIMAQEAEQIINMAPQLTTASPPPNELPLPPSWSFTEAPTPVHLDEEFDTIHFEPFDWDPEP